MNGLLFIATENIFRGHILPRHLTNGTTVNSSWDKDVPAALWWKCVLCSYWHAALARNSLSIKVYPEEWVKPVFITCNWTAHEIIWKKLCEVLQVHELPLISGSSGRVHELPLISGSSLSFVELLISLCAVLRIPGISSGSLLVGTDPRASVANIFVSLSYCRFPAMLVVEGEKSTKLLFSPFWGNTYIVLNVVAWRLHGFATGG